MALVTLAAISPALTDFGYWGLRAAATVRTITDATPPVNEPLAKDFPGVSLAGTLSLPSFRFTSAALLEGAFYDAVAIGDGFRVSSAGTLSAGTFTGIVTGPDADEVGLFDISVPVTTLLQVAATATTADDDALLRSLLGGDDIISVTADNVMRDVVAAGGGNDLIVTLGGGDAISGGSGRDVALGGRGDDSLSGDSGGDALLGEAGKDRIWAGTGDDLLDGGRDSDTLTGGAGADHFVFGIDTARDRVTDFQNGLDRLVFSDGPAGFSALRLTAVDPDSTVISWAGGSLRVDGVARAQLTAADMLFGAAADRAIAARINAALDANDYILA